MVAAVPERLPQEVYTTILAYRARFTSLIFETDLPEGTIVGVSFLHGAVLYLLFEPHSKPHTCLREEIQQQEEGT